MPLYLAMTGAELASCSHIPSQIGWLACHFSLSGPGLSNLPKTLPPHSLLILDDSTPFADHQAEIIAGQLLDCVSSLDADGVILDFQRPKEPQVQDLVCILQKKLPCPVAAPPGYGDGNCPVFLPPCPADQLLKEHLKPFQGRKIWLEVALDGMHISVTETGCQKESVFFPDSQNFPHKDSHLHCRYRIEQPKDAVNFSLQRTRDDLQKLLEEAENLGVAGTVGLWQEFKN